MFECLKVLKSFETRKTEKAKCPQKNEECHSTLLKTMPQAAGKKLKEYEKESQKCPKKI